MGGEIQLETRLDQNLRRDSPTYHQIYKVVGPEGRFKYDWQAL